MLILHVVHKDVGSVKRPSLQLFSTRYHSCHITLMTAYVRRFKDEP